MDNIGHKHIDGQLCRSFPASAASNTYRQSLLTPEIPAVRPCFWQPFKISSRLSPSLSRKYNILESMSPTRLAWMTQIQGHAKAGVHALSVLDGADGAASAQMAADGPVMFSPLLCRDFSQHVGNISVGCP